MLLSLLAWAAGGGGADAFDIEFSGRAVKRDVLALYDSRSEGKPHETRIHKLTEMPLNHLGFRVVYQDVNGPLPAATEMAAYRAVLTWFVEPLAKPQDYVAWLEQALAQGPRYVMLGEIAPRETDEMFAAVNRILARLGLRSAGAFVELTHRAKVRTHDRAMIGFEQKIDKAIPGFPIVTAPSSQTQVHLELEVPTVLGLQSSVVIATGNGGGYAAQNFTYNLEPNTDRLSWFLNPFLFFKLALGEERFPIPDVTTVSGRRLYFSHIDGDGWNNITEVEGYRERQALSSEVIAREAIELFPDLPVSVGLIAGDVQPLLGGIPEAARVARRIYASPQVEVASHTHTHPYNWNFFDAATYSRAEEERMVQAYRPPQQPIRERMSDLLMRAAGRDARSTRYDPYIAGTDDLPRTYLREPFDLQREVVGALRMSEQLAPAGKRAKLYLWSGDTTPFEAAVRATREAGVRNLNGGDSRLDREYPSVAYVPAIGRPIGRERQIYAVNSNENTYTNEWTGPFGGQLMLEHTLRNTDAPRRLKGFNLYYHMYSGEKPAALAAIRYLLALARASELTPIAASDYAAVADGFFTAEIAQIDLFAWAIVTRGQLQTVRFEEAEDLAIDLAKSTGVLGSRHVGTVLYVTLDPAVARAVVALRGRAGEAVDSPREPVLSLVHSRWRMSGAEPLACGLKVTAEGYGAGEMVWRTGRPRAFKMTVSRGSETLLEEIRFAGPDGLVTARIGLDAIVPLDIRFACHE